MKYFKLKNNPSEMGVVPQCEISNIDAYPFSSPNSINNAIRNNTLDKVILPDSLEIKYKAKITDILTISSIGFPFIIISKKFYEIIAKHSIPTHFQFPIVVSKMGKEKINYLFTSAKRFPEYINFHESQCIIGTRKQSWRDGPDDINKVEISNLDEFINLRDQLMDNQYLKIKDIRLNHDKIAYDLFLLPAECENNVFYIISDRLKNSIEASDLKGITFSDFE